MIKIFHFADLHLDSPFSGGDIKRSEAGRRRLRELFCAMMHHVRETGYDLVLIAGDLYDGGFVTEETAELVCRELSSLSCPVVISPGNHDPYSKGSLYTCGKFSDNVHIFSSEKLERFDFDRLGVSVYGYAFTDNTLRANLVAETYVADPKRINILCAHTDVASPLSPYAPMTYADIEAAGFSYAALGHIHKAPDVFRSASCVCAYSGFGEGRAFDEVGQGGAMAVSLFETGERASVSLERLSFSKYSFEVEAIDVSYIGSDADIEKKIKAVIKEKNYNKNTALRVVLEGMTDVGYIPNAELIAKKCIAEVDFIEIKDKTLPLLDGNFLEEDITVRGELYRALKEKMTSGNERERSLAGMALRIGLAALEGRDLSPFMPKDDTAARSEETNLDGSEA